MKRSCLFCNYGFIAVCTVKRLEVLELLTYVFFCVCGAHCALLAEQILHIWTYKYSSMIISYSYFYVIEISRGAYNKL